MKVYISTDIEGCANVTSWCETEYGQEGYAEACRQMTLETAAACSTAQSLGWKVVVKDGHGSGRNLDPWGLPKGTELIRSWRTSPAGMLGGLDETFDAVVCIGYHAPEGTDGSPLAHTVEHEWFTKVTLNDQLESEFSLNGLYASNLGIPTVFISGDQEICTHAQERCPGITAVSIKSGTGSSTWSMHPQDAIDAIAEGVKQALCNLEKVDAKCFLQNHYKLDMYFKEHRSARAASWYPGAEKIGPTQVRYETNNVDDLMIAKMFMTEI